MSLKPSCPDPIFAVIKRHIEAMAEFDTALRALVALGNDLLPG
jgi:hypothetical protein